MFIRFPEEIDEFSTFGLFLMNSMLTSNSKTCLVYPGTLKFVEVLFM